MPETCKGDEEWVDGYEKKDGTKVSGYCRKKHDNETPGDERKLSENGKKATGWEDRRR